MREVCDVVFAEVRVCGPRDSWALDGLVATGFFERLFGLLGPRAPDDGRALVFPACASLHTFGMGCPVDMAFVDGGGIVRLSRRAVPPRRVVSCPGAAWAVERVASTGRWLEESEIAQWLSMGRKAQEKGEEHEHDGG